MVVRDNTRHMVSFVEGMINEYDAGDFHDYWKLSRIVIDEMPVLKFYIFTGQTGSGFSTSPSRLNVAILTNKAVVDVFGGIRRGNQFSYGNESGGFAITPLKSIQSVMFHNGPLQTLQESSRAKLLLIARILGDASIGRYWVADTDDQYDHLVQFGKALMKAAVEA